MDRGTTRRYVLVALTLCFVASSLLIFRVSSPSPSLVLEEAVKELRSEAGKVYLSDDEKNALKAQQRKLSEPKPRDELLWSYSNPVPAIIPESFRLKNILEKRGFPMDQGR